MFLVMFKTSGEYIRLNYIVSAKLVVHERWILLQYVTLCDSRFIDICYCWHVNVRTYN